ncbi:MAG: hypothetical protein A3C56_08110 [Ignavibacteria bacterium RIFCSPHIGHO2_02_FULL_56_12]|nr:MAG: hypothetical protein A3C56_08110 [Ignavibacteria bacterium RIFCSPHIGHO2_02_FULL_56_12]
MPPEKEPQSSLEAFIKGRVGSRVRLVLDLDGLDLTTDFERTLLRLGYAATTVGAVEVQPGERVPAFFVENGIANFGWIFWEKFTDTRMRKLWGSEERNAKGDWALQIPANRETRVYANVRLKIPMDVDRPVG